jgi:DNA-directed RNA polymerase specialized sigma24 family protein
MNMTRDEVGKQLVSQFTRLHTYAKFLCKDPDVAEELFQDTCLKGTGKL